MNLNPPAGLIEALEHELKLDKTLLTAQSMGWKQLDAGVYIHGTDLAANVIQVVGMVQPNLSEGNIVWLV